MATAFIQCKEKGHIVSHKSMRRCPAANGQLQRKLPAEHSFGRDMANCALILCGVLHGPKGRMRAQAKPIEPLEHPRSSDRRRPRLFSPTPLQHFSSSHRAHLLSSLRHFNWIRLSESHGLSRTKAFCRQRTGTLSHLQSDSIDLDPFKLFTIRAFAPSPSAAIFFVTTPV